MTRQQAIDYIQTRGGRIFSVRFSKRTTGEERTMNCRRGVHSYLRGGEQRYNPDEKGLMVVFDMHRKSYRSIPIDNLTHIKVNGEWQEVQS